MRKRFNLYDKVRIKTGTHKGKVGVITNITTWGDRFGYCVSNHYIKHNTLGKFQAYEIEQISNENYLSNIVNF